MLCLLDATFLLTCVIFALTIFFAIKNLTYSQSSFRDGHPYNVCFTQLLCLLNVASDLCSFLICLWIVILFRKKLFSQIQESNLEHGGNLEFDRIRSYILRLYDFCCSLAERHVKSYVRRSRACNQQKVF